MRLNALAVLFVLASVTFLPLANLHAQERQKDELPLYPLKKGMKWTMTTRMENQGFWSIESHCSKSVTGTVLKNELLCYEITTIIKSTTISKTTKKQETTRHREYIAAKDDGFYLVAEDRHKVEKEGEAGEQISSWTPSPPVCILKTASKVLQKWEYVAGIGDDKFKTFYFQHSDTIKINGKEIECVVVVRADNRTKNKEWFWYIPGKGLVRHCYGGTDAEGRDFVNGRDTQTPWSFSDDASVKIGNVVLNKIGVEKEVSTESVEALAGVVTEFERSRTITRELSYSTKLGLGAEVELKLGTSLAVLKADLTTKIKASIETEIGEKLTASETRKQTIKIDGNVIQKARIVWIDVYRTGTIEVTQDEKTYSVPFEFPIGTRLVIRKQ